MKEKVKIKIGKIGTLPFYFNDKLIKKWNSDEFEIFDDINVKHITKRANIPIEKSQVDNGKKDHPLRYSDSILENQVPENEGANFSIWITYMPLKGNYFVRRLSCNRVVLSYFGMYDILKNELIPVENLLLRTIYRHILIYYKYDKLIPSHKDIPDIPFIHDDTRGCLFDMCVSTPDVVFFLNKPIICEECIVKLKCEENVNTDTVMENRVNQIIKECSKKIKRGSYYKIVALIKENPIRSLLLSALLGILLNLIATAIYNFFFK